MQIQSDLLGSIADINRYIHSITIVETSCAAYGFRSVGPESGVGITFLRAFGSIGFFPPYPMSSGIAINVSYTNGDIIGKVNNGSISGSTGKHIAFGPVLANPIAGSGSVFSEDLISADGVNKNTVDSHVCRISGFHHFKGYLTGHFGDDINTADIVDNFGHCKFVHVFIKKDNFTLTRCVDFTVKIVQIQSDLLGSIADINRYIHSITIVETSCAAYGFRSVGPESGVGITFLRAFGSIGFFPPYPMSSGIAINVSYTNGDIIGKVNNGSISGSTGKHIAFGPVLANPIAGSGSVFSEDLISADGYSGGSYHTCRKDKCENLFHGSFSFM